MLYLLTAPYMISMLWSIWENQAEQKTQTQEQMSITQKSAAQKVNVLEADGLCIELQDAHGRLTLSMEEYLCGALPATMDVDYEPQALAAQAILLRTEIQHRLHEEKEEGIWSGRMVLSQVPFLSQPILVKRWGSSYFEKEQKIRQAVSSTKGVYLTYDGLPITACFFALSAGKTRDGTMLSQGKYPYLKSVACPRDYLAEAYLTQVSFSKLTFKKMFGGELLKMNVDESGYVTKGYLLHNAEILNRGWISVLTGTELCRLLGLPSGHIKMEKNTNEIIFTCKGSGSGYGMSQFAANEMAKSGADFSKILSYFFAGTAFDKYE